MSNLLKALKRAERDREAAKQAQAGAAGTSAAQSVVLPAEQPAVMAAIAKPATPVTPATDDDATALPAVMRMQRDMVKPSERLAPHAASQVATPGPYRGVGISLTLAVLFAVGVGLWARDRDAGKQAVTGTISNRVIAPPQGTAQAAPRPTVIPAALRVSEAGPMQLRLDRSVEAIGQSVQQRVKAQ